MWRCPVSIAVQSSAKPRSKCNSYHLQIAELKRKLEAAEEHEATQEADLKTAQDAASKASQVRSHLKMAPLPDLETRLSFCAPPTAALKRGTHLWHTRYQLSC